MCRAIVYLLEMSQRWFAFVYDYLDVKHYLFVVVYGILIYDNFKYAELAYHFFIEELFYRNELKFEQMSQKLSSYFDANWRTWYEYCIQGVVQLFTVIIGFLPESF